MIKYIELTAPEASAFRQAKILSVECNEGDEIVEGTTLFKVKSGESEIDLPATREGKVIELIAAEGENITISTPLLLLEMEVEGSTATPPISDADKSEPEQNAIAVAAEEPKEKPKKKKRKTKKTTKNSNKHEQQMLMLTEGDVDQELSSESATGTDQAPAADQVPAADQAPATEPTRLNASETMAQDKQPTKTVGTSLASEQPEPPMSTQMSDPAPIQVVVPDIGSDSAKVIEILVSVGDTIDVEDALVTLESDKASMDVPSSHAGTVSAIKVAIDQDVSEGDLIVELESTEQHASDGAENLVAEEEPAAETSAAAPSESTATPSSAADTKLVEVSIPDIGGDAAKVIELLVKPGDTVAVEDPLLTLESDKASMDVPSTVAGVIDSLQVNLEDDVTEGTVIAIVSTASSSSTDSSEPKQANTTPTSSAPPVEKPAQASAVSTPTAAPSPAVASGDKSHASPSIRRLARELGVDLSKITGSGRKNRITQDDLKAYVKDALNSAAPRQATHSTAGAGIPQVPAQDFSKFGEIDVQPLNRIKKLTASNLHRSWLNVPHVTHNDESNISDLESFRKQLNAEYKSQNRDIKLSPLAFVVKAVVNALQTYPQFNSSLEPGGENLIYKKYFNIGIAVDTPNGLVVPVVKDADKKSVAEIAKEMGDLAAKARDKKLTMNDMSGACITISSLGGIGGTGFTPIVNAPEVAILGVSRSKMQPVWNGSEFIPGMILPLSLSYDHRVIDGAEAARFTRHIAAVLEDVRRLTV